MNQTLGQKVNSVGQRLYKTLDGAYKFHKSSNMFDIYSTVLYQAKGKPDVQEMTININITTYKDKLRINVIELGKYEKTLGHATYTPEKFTSDEEVVRTIIKDVRKKIEKAYSMYEFLY